MRADRTSDAAQAIKDAVSCKAFAEFMGLRPDRKGFCVCPFHGDTDASFKIYENGEKGGGWCCFGCHKGGDVINLAKYWYGMEFKDAVRQVDADFGLGLFEDTPESRRKAEISAAKRIKEQTRRERETREKETAEREFLDLLGAWLDFKFECERLRPKTDADWTEEFAKALRAREITEIELELAELRRDSLCSRRN